MKRKRRILMSLLTVIISIANIDTSTALFTDTVNNDVYVRTGTVDIAKTKDPNQLLHIKSNSSGSVVSQYKNTSSDKANLTLTLTISEALPNSVKAYIDGKEVFNGKTKEVLEYKDIDKDGLKDVNVEFKMEEAANPGDHIETKEFTLTQSAVMKSTNGSWVSQIITSKSVIKYGGEDLPGIFTQDKVIINESELTTDEIKKLDIYKVNVNGKREKITFDQIEELPGETIIRRTKPREFDDKAPRNVKDIILVYNKEPDATYTPGAKYKITATLDGLVGQNGITGGQGPDGAPGELEGKAGYAGPLGKFTNGIVTVSVDPHIYVDEVMVVNTIAIKTNKDFNSSLTSEFANKLRVYKNEYIDGKYVRTEVPKENYTITNSNGTNEVVSKVNIKGNTSKVVNYQLVYDSNVITLNGSSMNEMSFTSDVTVVGNKTGERSTDVKYYYDGIPIDKYYADKGQKPIVEKLDKYNVKVSLTKTGRALKGPVGPNGNPGPAVNADVVLKTLGMNPTASNAKMYVTYDRIPPKYTGMDVMNGNSKGFALQTIGTGDTANVYELGSLGYWYESKLKTLEIKGAMGRPQLIARVKKDGPLNVYDSDEDGNMTLGELTKLSMRELLALNEGQINLITAPFIQPVATIEEEARFDGTATLYDDYGRIVESKKVTKNDSSLTFADTPFMTVNLEGKTPADIKSQVYEVNEAKGRLELTGASDDVIIEGNMVNGFNVSAKEVITKVEFWNIANPSNPVPYTGVRNIRVYVSHPTIDVSNSSFSIGGQPLTLIDGTTRTTAGLPAVSVIEGLPKGSVIELDFSSGSGYQKPPADKEFKATVGVDEVLRVELKKSAWTGTGNY